MACFSIQQFMLVTTKRQRLNTNSLCLSFKDEALQMITSDKILGVFVDNNLLWSEHAKHLAKKKKKKKKKKNHQIYGFLQKLSTSYH